MPSAYTRTLLGACRVLIWRNCSDQRSGKLLATVREISFPRLIPLLSKPCLSWSWYCSQCSPSPSHKSSFVFLSRGQKGLRLKTKTSFEGVKDFFTHLRPYLICEILIRKRCWLYVTHQSSSFHAWPKFRHIGRLKVSEVLPYSSWPLTIPKIHLPSQLVGSSSDLLPSLSLYFRTWCASC